MKRRIIAGAIVFMMLLSVVGSVVFAESTKAGFDITIDNKPLYFNSKYGYPEIIDGSTYVPIRFITETMGYQVLWNAIERKVTVINEEPWNRLDVNVDGNQVYIKYDRAMVPLRFITQSFGATVGYEKVDGNHQIRITTYKPEVVPGIGDNLDEIGDGPILRYNCRNNRPF